MIPLQKPLSILSI